MLHYTVYFNWKLLWVFRVLRHTVTATCRYSCR